MLAGVLTARLQQRRFIQEDLISIALIVFGLAVITENGKWLFSLACNIGLGPSHFTLASAQSGNIISGSHSVLPFSAACGRPHFTIR